MALIGEDCAVVIKFGTVSGAGNVTWDAGGAYAISGKCKRISAEDSCELTNTKGLGDGRKLHRSHSGSTRVELERLVGYLGYNFIGASGGTRIGDACQIQIREYSGLGTQRVFTGVVERWKGDIQETEAQIESLTIMCDIDAYYT